MILQEVSLGMGHGISYPDCCKIGLELTFPKSCAMLCLELAWTASGSMKPGHRVSPFSECVHVCVLTNTKQSRPLMTKPLCDISCYAALAELGSGCHGHRVVCTYGEWGASAVAQHISIENLIAFSKSLYWDVTCTPSKPHRIKQINAVAKDRT